MRLYNTIYFSVQKAHFQFFFFSNLFHLYIICFCSLVLALSPIGRSAPSEYPPTMLRTDIIKISDFSPANFIFIAETKVCQCDNLRPLFHEP